MKKRIEKSGLLKGTSSRPRYPVVKFQEDHRGTLGCTLLIFLKERTRSVLHLMSWLLVASNGLKLASYLMNRPIKKPTSSLARIGQQRPLQRLQLAKQLKLPWLPLVSTIYTLVDNVPTTYYFFFFPGSFALVNHHRRLLTLVNQGWPYSLSLSLLFSLWIKRTHSF